MSLYSSRYNKDSLYNICYKIPFKVLLLMKDQFDILECVEYAQNLDTLASQNKP